MAVENLDILRVTAKMSFVGGTSQVQNVFHLQLAGDSQDDQDVWDSIAAWLDAAYGEITGYQTTNLSYDTIRVDNVTQNYLVGEDAWPTRTAGASGTENVPLQCAPFIEFPTPQLKVWARKFLPPITEGSSSYTGTIAGAALTAIAAWADAIIDPIVDLAGTILTYGAYRYADPEESILARFLPVIGYVVSEIQKTQRRRTFGRGT